MLSTLKSVTEAFEYLAKHGKTYMGIHKSETRIKHYLEYQKIKNNRRNAYTIQK